MSHMDNLESTFIITTHGSLLIEFYPVFNNLYCMYNVVVVVVEINFNSISIQMFTDSKIFFEFHIIP